jgi:hypothetical protein
MSTEPPNTTVESSDEGGMNFWVSALLGAAVSIVAGFVPLSPILGGGVAGYLNRGRREDGLRVGAVSGAIAAIPIVLILALVFGGLSVVSVVDRATGGLLVFLFLLVFTVVVAMLVSAGLSALGGYLGVYIREETTAGARGDDETGGGGESSERDVRAESESDADSSTA